MKQIISKEFNKALEQAKPKDSQFKVHAPVPQFPVKTPVEEFKEKKEKWKQVGSVEKPYLDKFRDLKRQAKQVTFNTVQP